MLKRIAWYTRYFKIMSLWLQRINLCMACDWNTWSMSNIFLLHRRPRLPRIAIIYWESDISKSSPALSKFYHVLQNMYSNSWCTHEDMGEEKNFFKVIEMVNCLAMARVQINFCPFFHTTMEKIWPSHAMIRWLKCLDKAVLVFIWPCTDFFHRTMS